LMRSRLKEWMGTFQRLSGRGGSSEEVNDEYLVEMSYLSKGSISMEGSFGLK